jgi:hypothetical protein
MLPRQILYPPLFFCILLMHPMNFVIYQVDDAINYMTDNENDRMMRSLANVMMMKTICPTTRMIMKGKRWQNHMGMTF